MHTSLYQNVKLHILSFCHLSKDAAHIYIGLIVFLVYVLLFRKRLGSFKALVPVLLIAVGMELLDLRDDFNALGNLRWGASLHDILNTLFWPTVIVLLAKVRLIKSI